MPIRRFAARALVAVAPFVGLNCAKAPPGRFPINQRGLHGAVSVLALVVTAACRDGTPTGATSLPPQATVAHGSSAAKGKPTAALPDGKGIGTLQQTGVQRTRYRVEFHLGQVMTSTSNVYLIWYGNWTNDAAPTIIRDLVIGLGGSPYFRINTLYPDASGAAPSGGLIFGGAVNDLYSRGPTLSDQDIKDIVLNQMAMEALPVDPRGSTWCWPPPMSRRARAGGRATARSTTS